jgi:predicted HTH transcriptional regulator
MNTITQETRNESYEIIQPEINDRQQQCLKGLQELGQATANELAMYLANKGVTPFFSRNFVHPRLNELVEDKKVKIIGKKKDLISNRSCAIYEVAKIN